MASILIRDISDDDLMRIDAHATRLGLSRTEYVRRRLHQDALRAATRVTVSDLARLGTLCADLEDDEVMRQAWS